MIRPYKLPGYLCPPGPDDLDGIIIDDLWVRFSGRSPEYPIPEGVTRQVRVYLDNDLGWFKGGSARANWPQMKDFDTITAHILAAMLEGKLDPPEEIR